MAIAFELQIPTENKIIINNTSRQKVKLYVNWQNQEEKYTYNNEVQNRLIF